MSAPEVNVPLLRKAVEWVEEQDAQPVLNREWEQGLFYTDPRGVAMYVRSRTYMEDGSAVMERMQERADAEWCGTAYCVAGKITTDLELNADNPSESARMALGLTPDQAADLFGASNTAEDVRRIAEDIAGERL